MSQLQFKLGNYKNLYKTTTDKEGQSITVINSKVENGDMCFAKFSDDQQNNNGALIIKIDGTLYNLTNIPGPMGQPLVGQGSNKGSIYSSQVRLNYVNFCPTTDTDLADLAGRISCSSDIFYLAVGFKNSSGNHYEGRIRCFNKSGYRTEIRPGEDIEETEPDVFSLVPSARNNYFYLPSGEASGYARAVWKSEDARLGVGSSTQPVYVDNYGQVKKSTGYELYADIVQLDQSSGGLIARGAVSAGGLFVYNSLDEIPDTSKEVRLTLGNDWTIAPINRYGIIELYNVSNKKNIIKTQDLLSTDTIFYLPNSSTGIAYGAWISSLSDTVGNSNLPVYVNNKGQLVPCNELIHSLVSSGNFLTLDAGNTTITVPIINSISGTWQAPQNSADNPYLTLSINGKSENISIDPASGTIGGIVTTHDQTFAGTKTFIGNLLPDEVWTYCIGTDQKPWSDIYAGGFHLNNDNGIMGGEFTITDWTPLEPGTSIAVELSIGNAYGKVGSVNSTHGILKIYNENGGNISIKTDNEVQSQDIGTLYLPDISGNGYAVWSDSNTTSSETEPIYINNDYQIQKGKTYAGGTAVTLNGEDCSAKSVEIYAPITSGSQDGLVLISTFKTEEQDDGTNAIVNTAPRWIEQKDLSAGIDANSNKPFSEMYETKEAALSKYETAITHAEAQRDQAMEYSDERLIEESEYLTSMFNSAISASETAVKKYADDGDDELETTLKAQMGTLQTSLEEAIQSTSDELLEQISAAKEEILGSDKLAESLNTLTDIAEWINTHEEAAADLVLQFSEEEKTRAAEDETLNAKIENEVSAREQADNALQAAIDLEIQNRASAISTLNQNLTATIGSTADQLDKKIAAEVTARQASNETLDAKINAAVSDLTAADEQLATNLSNETTARTTEDNKLLTAITKEQERAGQAELTLQDNLDIEIERATSKEEAILEQLRQEITRSTEKDTNFDNTSFSVADNSGLDISGSALGEDIVLTGVPADGNTAGIINASAQNFNGIKTFNSGITISTQLVLGSQIYGPNEPTGSATAGQIYFKLI